MNTRSARLIAGQTLVTVILMGVIVATLLSPETNNELFGVDLPGTDAPIAQGPPTHKPSDEGRNARDDESAGGQGGTAQPDGAAPATGVTPAPSSATPVVPAVPPIRPGAAGDAGDPTGDQYADTLARLSQSLE